MRCTQFLSRLASDCSGAMAVEFALLAPAFLVMLLGVLQVGLGLQNYNAMRNLSADVARYAMVQHQTGNTINNTQIRTFALNRATGVPYLLTAGRINAAVNDAANQRVAGAKELQVTITYQIDSLLEFAGVSGPFISYRRPIFLIEE